MVDRVGFWGCLLRWEGEERRRGIVGSRGNILWEEDNLENDSENEYFYFGEERIIVMNECHSFGMKSHAEFILSCFFSCFPMPCAFLLSVFPFLMFNASHFLQNNRPSVKCSLSLSLLSLSSFKMLLLNCVTNFYMVFDSKSQVF